MSDPRNKSDADRESGGNADPGAGPGGKPGHGGKPGPGGNADRSYQDPRHVPSGTGGQSGDGGLHYHYSRSERLEQGGRDREQAKKGSIFRRNRSLTLILIDVALILVIYLLFTYVFNTQPTTHDYGGYSFTIRAVAFGDEVLCTVRADQKDPEEGVAGAPARVVFESGEAREETSDLLPTGQTGERNFRARLPRAEAGEEVRATVYIGEAQFSIETQVTAE